MLTEEQCNSVIDCISSSRIATYNKVLAKIHDSSSPLTNLDKVLFYAKIQDIYSCFYVVIQTLEITLRNRIYNALENHYGTKSCFNSLMQEHFCTTTTKNIINTALKKTQMDFKCKQCQQYTSQDVLARITFGLWPELLQPSYRKELFWQKYGSTVFPNKDRAKLSQIHNDLMKIGKLRNRLYHYEPLWKTTKEFSDSNQLMETLQTNFFLIMQLIKYCSLEKYELMENMKQTEQLKNKMDELSFLFTKKPSVQNVLSAA